MRRISRWHFGCCCLGEGTWSSTQTNYTRSSHTSCMVHSAGRWGFSSMYLRTLTNLLVLFLC